MEASDESDYDVSVSESEYNPSSSSSKEESTTQKRTKKRTRNESKWVCNIRKMKRTRGEEYINVCGKVVPARSTGPECKCKRKCYSKVSDNIKAMLFQSFNELKNKECQDAYLCGLITVCKVQRRRPKTGKGNVRTQSFLYKVRHRDFETVVCKLALCGLHGITKSRVERLCKHLTEHATPPSDNRGRHVNRPLKISQHITALVDAHIKSFPRRKSHYSRSDNKKHYYLSSDLSVKKMHLLYLQKYEPEVYLSIESGIEIKSKVSYDFYYRYFTTHFNMSFGKPRSDTCQVCDNMEKQLISCKTEQEKQEIRTQKELHLRRAERFYSLLKEKTAVAKDQKDVETICIDYQKNMAMPSIPAGDVFYSRQLWEFSFCIHAASIGKSYFYMYDETCGKKGPSEVISMLHHFINNILDENVKVLNIFSDNCSAQNKNHNMVQYLYTQIHNERFKKISHMFPVPGHSFLPCDRSFGIVEKQKRKQERLYVPKDWQNLVKQTSKKFKVFDVTQDLFLDFTSHFKDKFKTTVMSKDKEKYAISKYRLFEFSTEHKDTVRCSKSLSIEILHDDFIIKRPSASLTFPEAKLYNGPLAIKKAKYSDVMSLAKKYVPPSDMWFYKQLVCERTWQDATSSSSEEEPEQENIN